MDHANCNFHKEIRHTFNLNNEELTSQNLHASREDEIFGHVLGQYILDMYHNLNILIILSPPLFYTKIFY